MVMPLLFALLLGVIAYGLWFNDSISVRQGVGEAARKAAGQSSFAWLKDPVTNAAFTSGQERPRDRDHRDAPGRVALIEWRAQRALGRSDIPPPRRGVAP